ncbi:MAG TPA: cobalamin-binding protein [Steroidobacteraceae bacterium]|nr:cobalamin-binding protein [Steroidobacteraceae bacterium]
MRRLLALVLALAAVPCEAGTAPARRIVSLAPNITELLYTAGAGDRIVAAVEFSDYPAAAKQLPRIGDAFRIDYERLLALEPDLVIAWRDGTPGAMVNELRRLKQPVRELRIAGLDDVATALRELGSWTGTAATADRAAVEYLARLESLRARHRGDAPLSVFFEISATPLYTVNDRHPISEVIRLCGGSNIFADLGQLAPAVGIESVLARNPEVILFADDEPASLEYWERWPQLTAVREHNLYAVSSDRISRTTVRILEGAEQVCERLADVRRRRAAAH